ncbi:hypothetical protein [Salipaludibacillus agaradhaerens]|jgi:hypothetical protein|nr:hypothetical protein [Salipaludibacillus agaradhaerens]
MSIHEQVEEDAEASLKGVFEQAESELNQINVEIVLTVIRAKAD